MNNNVNFEGQVRNVHRQDRQNTYLMGQTNRLLLAAYMADFGKLCMHVAFIPSQGKITSGLMSTLLCRLMYSSGLQVSNIILSWISNEQLKKLWLIKASLCL